MSSADKVIDTTEAELVEEVMSEETSTTSSRQKKMNDKHRTCVMYCVWIMQYLIDNNVSLSDIKPREYINTIFPILNDEENTPEEQYNFFVALEKSIKKDNSKRTIAAKAKAEEKAALKAQKEAEKQAAKAERDAAKKAAKAEAAAARKAAKMTTKEKAESEVNELLEKEEAPAPRRGGAAKKKVVNTKANLIDELCGEPAAAAEPEPASEPKKRAPRGKKATEPVADAEATEPAPEPKKRAPRKKAAEADATEPAPEPKKRAPRKKAVKSDTESSSSSESESEPEPEPEPKKRAPRGSKKAAAEPVPEPEPESDVEVVRKDDFEDWQFEGQSYLKNKHDNLVVMLNEETKEYEMVGVYDPETNTIVPDEDEEETD
jgi:hypothetical protein